jgi:putative transposase
MSFLIGVEQEALMLMLLAITELLQTIIQGVLHWFAASSCQRRSNKPVLPVNKHDHRHTPQKPEWLKHEFIRLKACMPQAGCRSIADICNRRFAASHHCGRVAAKQRGTHRRTPCGCITVGKTFVHQILQQHDYEIQILRRKLKHAKPKAVPRNLIWGIDLTGKTDTNKRLHYLLGILDHGSRALLHLQALHDKTTPTIIHCLNQIIRTYGKPKAIRTDNEGMFRSLAFSQALERLGIRHQRTDPGCPWQNGRIERLFGTLKDKLDQWSVAGIEQLNFDLNTFRHWYNHIRPHQNLEGRTPAEAWRGINPYAKSPKQEQWFEAWDGLLAGYELKY